MINICIVEDEKEQADRLREYLQKFSSVKELALNIDRLQDGLDLVEDYKGQYDIILLDIQMKHMNGMVAAEKIRLLDSDVVIIFITSTVQYAVQGYAVDALGYVLKPVPYAQFEQLMDKAVAKVKARQSKTYIRISVEDAQLKIDCDSISYIESQRNNVVIHADGGNYTTPGPLKKFEEILENHSFSKCHNAYLINLSRVSGVQKEEVILAGGIKLPISRAKKKEFMAELTNDLL